MPMIKIQTSLALFTLLLWSIALPAQAPNALTAQEKAEGWQLLFDGATLKGWHAAPPAPGSMGRAGAPPLPPGQIGTSPKPCGTARGEAASAVPGAPRWEVVDGSLEPCGGPIGFLVSDQSYRNFVLSMEFKSSEDANSGVYFRSTPVSGGYEAQIWRAQPGGFTTGAVVGSAKTARAYPIKHNQWNHYLITADGDHLVVVLNGETTVDVRDSRFAEGHFRLQYQQHPIAFRNIKIRLLP
jgi:hypothetical protein